MSRNFIFELKILHALFLLAMKNMISYFFKKFGMKRIMTFLPIVQKQTITSQTMIGTLVEPQTK